MLPLAVAVCLVWTLVFLILAEPLLALILAAGAVLMGCCWMISERVCLSTGMILAEILCLAITTTFCLVLDLPTDAVPRTSHGYFLVIGFGAYIDFRRAPGLAPLATICASICGFVAFSSMPLHFQFAQPVADPIRIVMAWLNATATVFLLGAMHYVVRRRAALNKRLARELASAVAQGELELLLRPQVDRSRKVIGAEAVLRWNRVTGARFDAGACMATAEKAGLASQIDAWLLAEAVHTLSRWQLRSHTYDLVLSVGVSPERLLSAGFVEELGESLRSHGVHARHLRLDLNGRAATADYAPLVERMDQLRALGLSIALSGVGTGSNALTYLEHMPLQQLNLDANSTADGTDNRKAATVARNLVELAQELGLTVLAQGIEIEPQFAFMRECGCQSFEGPLFGSPLSLQAFDAHVQATRSERLPADEMSH
ncbi:EAL domain-containing protein [Novosphingobium sp. 9U]|uniref:EAL domain-containing protein n=1 Tax=Novosphingobium sp. 9U TaxID=2653158 RepID=UPI0012F2EEC9|nr:EAL domain-containing protein [Novosphingobium sp. 9U]VWX51980.1 putative Bacteriophytochrome cph2 [Novosphingobium sp. 9U]